MEYLDYYDEFGNHLGVETREKIHELGLWHKTVQNWLYTKDGKVLFQIRKNTGKFYTTSSGHVDAGETLEEAYIRETREEIGLDMTNENPKVIDLVTWVMDKKKDGKTIKDRAKSTFFLGLYDGDFNDFKFDTNEVLGVVLVDAKETLDLFKKGHGQIDALLIVDKDGVNEQIKRQVDFDEFLLFEGEDIIQKYGKILTNVIEETKKITS